MASEILCLLTPDNLSKRNTDSMDNSSSRDEKEESFSYSFLHSVSSPSIESNRSSPLQSFEERDCKISFLDVDEVSVDPTVNTTATTNILDISRHEDDKNCSSTPPLTSEITTPSGTPERISFSSSNQNPRIFSLGDLPAVAQSALVSDSTTSLKQQAKSSSTEKSKANYMNNTDIVKFPPLNDRLMMLQEEQLVEQVQDTRTRLISDEDELTTAYAFPNSPLQKNSKNKSNNNASKKKHQWFPWLTIFSSMQSDNAWPQELWFSCLILTSVFLLAISIPLFSLITNTSTSSLGTLHASSSLYQPTIPSLSASTIMTPNETIMGNSSGEIVTESLSTEKPLNVTITFRRYHANSDQYITRNRTVMMNSPSTPAAITTQEVSLSSTDMTSSSTSTIKKDFPAVRISSTLFSSFSPSILKHRVQVFFLSLFQTITNIPQVIFTKWFFPFLSRRTMS
jgi:hypothetical protein